MRCDERGAAAVEWALLVPLLLMCACVAVAGARLALARQHVHDAVGSAARAATVQKSASAGDRAARGMLSANLVTCQSSTVSIDVSALRAAPGTPGSVTVSATCVVLLSDLLVPGLPGSITVDAVSSAAVDTYSRRGP